MPWADRALGHGLLGSDSIARGSVEFEASNPNDLRRVIGDELCPVLQCSAAVGAAVGKVGPLVA